MKLSNIIIIILGMLLIVYILMSFVMWNFKVNTWDLIDRTVLIVISLVSTIYIIGINWKNEEL